MQPQSIHNYNSLQTAGVCTTTTTARCQQTTTLHACELGHWSRVLESAITCCVHDRNRSGHRHCGDKEQSQEWWEHNTQIHTHHQIVWLYPIDNRHISPSEIVVNIGATELAGLCTTLDVIGSRDLIGAVHVEGESITHKHTHTITPKCVHFIYLCLCEWFQTCMWVITKQNSFFVVDWFVGLIANCCVGWWVDLLNVVSQWTALELTWWTHSTQWSLCWSNLDTGQKLFLGLI